MTSTDGKSYQQRVFNEEGCMLIAMKSQQAKSIEFQKWAVKTLKNHRQTGFTLPAHIPKQLGKNDVKRVRQIMVDFALDYGKRHAPEGYGVDATFSLKWVHKFVRHYYNVSSHKNLSKEDISGLANTLLLNEGLVFDNAEGIFAVKPSTEIRIALRGIEQGETGFVSFRVKGNAYYKHMTIQQILSIESLEAEISTLRWKLKKREEVNKRLEAQLSKNVNTTPDPANQLASLPQDLTPQLTNSNTQSLLLDCVNLSQNIGALAKQIDTQTYPIAVLINSNADLLAFKLEILARLKITT